MVMIWQFAFHEDFAIEAAALPDDVKIAIEANTMLLARFGPHLGRPRADTLVGSKHANMKELRFSASGGVWRLAFAFDPERRAILLVAADKSGVAQSRFYKKLIAVADRRFSDHLDRLEKTRR